MNFSKRGFRAMAVGLLVAAGLAMTPAAFARGHLSVGVSVPGVSIGYNTGYWGPRGYVGANCYNALASLQQVDPKRIGIVGHSYGGKWAMFASCFCDKYAAAVWSDPDLVWDEQRSNANYWEPWYLGLDANLTRKPGLITADNPRTGAYKTLVESGHDLVELHALMAPRPLLVSGGAEDPPARWLALNHLAQVNKLLGYSQRVGLTSRPAHDPTPQSNEAICVFFEHFLMGK